jgi:hypothetical protein
MSVTQVHPTAAHIPSIPPQVRARQLLDVRLDSHSAIAAPLPPIFVNRPMHHRSSPPFYTPATPHPPHATKTVFPNIAQVIYIPPCHDLTMPIPAAAATTTTPSPLRTSHRSTPRGAECGEQQQKQQIYPPPKPGSAPPSFSVFLQFSPAPPPPLQVSTAGLEKTAGVRPSVQPASERAAPLFRDSAAGRSGRGGAGAGCERSSGRALM